MRDKLGNLLMVIGAALIVGALSLFLYNQNEANKAQQAVEALLPQLVEEIQNHADAEEEIDEEIIIPGTPEEWIDPSAYEMREVEIDGYAYIGYLTIPKLDLYLPIMSEWDYPRLKIAPCRYTGTVKGENLVLLAHNYTRHFGRLSELELGDVIRFTDMDGVTTEYEVMAMDILAPTAVDTVTSAEYDLTLFTCTYGGQSRVTVFCDIVKE